MTPVISLLSLPAMQALALALIHFLWQGAVLGLAAAVVMRWVATSASMRYYTGVVTLALMCAAPVGTFLLSSTNTGDGSAVVQSPPIASPVDTRGTAALEVAGESATLPASQRLLPAVLVLWLSGVLLLSGRLLGGWAVARRLAVQTTEPATAEVEALATRVAEQLGLRRLVRIAESPSITVPIVIGWLKPVVLVPTAAVAGLAPAHLEALLAHELAHVRRHDYLINLLQSAVETLLFYHPAVWWVSKRVRQEREHCCDDEAVAICDRMVYVHALTDLAAMSAEPRLALAATDGSLLRRVRRLLTNRPEERPAPGWLLVSLALLLAAALTPAALALAGDQRATPTPEPAPAAGPVPAPAPNVRAQVQTPRGEVVTPAAAAATIRAAVQAEANRAQAQEVEAEARANVLRQQLMQLQVELEALAERRRQVDDHQLTQELQLRREAAVEQLVAVQTELKAAVTRQERGLVQQDVVNDVRARVAEAERAVRGVDIQLESNRARQQMEATQASVRARAAEVRARLTSQEAARSQAAPSPAPRPTPTPSGVYTIGNGVAEPKLLTRVEPAYPAVAKAARMQGAVYVEAIIGRGGRVRDARAVGGAPFAPLREAAVAAVRQWIYEPTIVNGEPVEVQFATQVMFRLNDGATSNVPAAVPGAVPLTDPTAVVRAGDLLVISIAGEDQLPRWYAVDKEGTIRLPLMGRLPVVDRTAAQVRAAIADALARHNLGRALAGPVVIHRPPHQ